LIFLPPLRTIWPKCWRICKAKQQPKNLILEHQLSEEARELARLLLQVDSRGSGDLGTKVISAAQVELNHRRKMPRTLYTVFGQVTINRVGYSRQGHHSLFPLDAQLNLPLGSLSYGLQQMVVRESTKGSFEESLLTIERLTGVKISFAYFVW